MKKLIFIPIIIAVVLLGIAAQQQGGGGGSGAGTITGVTAGTGLNGGGSSGSVTLNLSNVIPTGTDTGSANAYVVANLSPAITAYGVGAWGCFKAVNVNTLGAPTVNFNGLGTKTIVRFNGLVLSGSDININELSCMVYDGTNFDLINTQNTTGSGSITLSTAPAFVTSITTPLLKTTTKCAANGTAASPSVVSCTAAPAGVVSCDDTTGGLCTVSTTAMLTANSTVLVTQDTSTTTGTLLGVTCNTTFSAINPSVTTAKVAATSFSFTMTTPVTNPGCFQYLIVN